jgi:hypothetical protein
LIAVATLWGVALDKDTISGWIGILVIAGIAGWLYFVGFDATWYAVEYKVSPDKVHVDTKPKDCDFMHAPLGNKECHYEAKATAYNAAGLSAAAGFPDQKINSVVVTWSKVKD